VDGLIAKFLLRANVSEPVSAAGRRAALPCTNQQMEIGLLTSCGLSKQVIDISFAVADANDGRLGAPLGRLFSPVKAFQPADALFLFDWQLASNLNLLAFGGVTDLRARPVFLTDDSLGHSR
jgi:hypothetical protein